MQGIVIIKGDFGIQFQHQKTKIRYQLGAVSLIINSPFLGKSANTTSVSLIITLLTSDWLQCRFGMAELLQWKVHPPGQLKQQASSSSTQVPQPSVLDGATSHI